MAANTTDMYYYTDAEIRLCGGTGTFYARPNSDSDILTYSEMCFIKAEVLFRKRRYRWCIGCPSKKA